MNKVIHNSTQWVDPAKNKEWYSLRVINDWDFTTKTICFKRLSDGYLISYCLNKNTSVSDTGYERHIVTNLSQEMKDELVSMGYTLVKKHRK